MKIRISESESYEIAIPEEVDMESFHGLMERLGRVLKMVGKDVLASCGSVGEARGKSRNYGRFRKDRELCVEVVKSYYGEDKRALEEFMEEMDLHGGAKKDLYSALYILKKYHNIQPDEVGLIRYPKKGETFKSVRKNGKEVTEENGSGIEEEKEEEG